MTEPTPSSGEPAAASARPFFDWLPTYLALLSINGHHRALHVAKVDEATVQAARAAHPTIEDACQRILAMRECREAERKLATTPAPAAASAADLCHFIANGHAKSAILQADFSTLLRLVAVVAEHFGVQHVDGLSIYEWFNRERRLQLERELLRIGDTDPEFAEHLQRQIEAVCRQAGPGAILPPPQD